jgi:hypothetical protein
MRITAAKGLRHSGHRRRAGPAVHSSSAQAPQSPLRERVKGNKFSGALVLLNALVLLDLCAQPLSAWCET